MEGDDAPATAPAQEEAEPTTTEPEPATAAVDAGDQAASPPSDAAGVGEELATTATTAAAEVGEASHPTQQEEELQQEEQATSPAAAAAAAGGEEKPQQDDGQQPQPQDDASASSSPEPADAAAAPVQTPSSADQRQLSSSAPGSSSSICRAADAAAAEAPSSTTSYLQHVLSTAATKRSNLQLLEDGTLAMAAGCAVLLLHLPTGQQRFLPGRDGGGVAAVAVHPSRRLFLVAEKCHSRPPNIYIYSYPDLALQHTLPAGTERAYSAACFSPGDGSRLAAVGSAPDYQLTLWDWAAGATLLRCKAFGQEVYGLGFCPHSPGRLVSCGTGHIRFWRMASTFTGLKLQGDLGRFGAVELSDVAAFVELPDGKVLSGSEAGDLLLWEGGLIKAVITRPGGARCHEGPIEVLLHSSDSSSSSNGYLISGGGDGLLRLWEAARVQEAEPPEGSNRVELKPAVTVALPAAAAGGVGLSSGSGIGSSGCGRGVRGLVWLDPRTWLVQSEAGALFKVSVPLNILDQGAYSVSTLMTLQSGGVVGCCTLPDRHVLLTAAGDGTITALDYRSQAVLQRRQLSSRISSVAMLPLAADPRQRHMLLGCADGCVVLVARCSDGWEVQACARPHKVPVSCMAVSSDGRRLAAVAADGGVFFLQIHYSSRSSSSSNDSTQQPPQQQQQQQQLEPLVAGQLGEVGTGSPSCCCWDASGSRLLVGCSSGVAVEVALPELPGSLDTSRTFQHQLPTRRFVARLPRQQQQQERHEQHEQPPQALLAGASAAAGNAEATAADATNSSLAEQQQQPEQDQPQQQQPAAGTDAPSQAAAAEAASERPAAAAPSAAAAAVVAEDVCDEDAPAVPITCVSYCAPCKSSASSSSDTFLLWLGGQAAGQVLTCSWATQPPRALSAAQAAGSGAESPAALSVQGVSWSGAYRLAGTTDGQVRLEEAASPHRSSWQCGLHDMHDGRVTGLAMAFDDSCVISAAADGTLLLLANPLLTEPPGAAASASLAVQEPNAGLPTMAGSAVAAATGSSSSSQASTAAAATSSTAVPLSLEEAKQAAQRDQHAATAAAARQQLVGAVEVLRQELAALMREDAARPAAERLPDEAFEELDAGLLPALVQREREARLAAAQAKVAYDAEAAALRLSKLQAYFDATLAEHVVVVHPLPAVTEAGVGGGSSGKRMSVCTLRPPELPREVEAALAEAQAEEARLKQQQQQQSKATPGGGGSMHLTRSSASINNSSSSSGGGGGQQQQQRTSKGSFRARVSQEAVLGSSSTGTGAHGNAASSAANANAAAPSRAELWRQAKRQRAAEWAAFNASRPDDTYDAPEDLQALQQAATTVGDFRLKSDPGFMLPEDQRWTPAKKRRQMLLLMRQLSDARASHNSAVLALRARKRGLVGQLNSLQATLAGVESQLGGGASGSGGGHTEAAPQQQLAMQPDEEPEQQLSHVTEAQLAEHLAAAKRAAQAAAASADSKSGLGGLGGGFASAGTAAAAAAAGSAAVPLNKKQQQQHLRGGSSSGAGVQADAGRREQPVAVRQLSQQERHRLEVQRQQLTGAIQQLSASFNASLAALRGSQLQLAVGIKAAEGRLLLMLRELALLKDAEHTELALEAKRDAKLAEAEEMAGLLAELQAQLDDRRAEGEAGAARREALVAELQQLLAETQQGTQQGQGQQQNPEAFREVLTRVFHRRIKRAKKHGGAGNVSGGAGADSSDDDSDDGGGGGSDMGGSEDGSGSDSSDSEEVCPPGCDPALYEAVVELREHRLDEEEAAAELSKVVEGLTKDRALLGKRAKLVEAALAAINQEVLDFQVDKQSRLNQLPATVILRRHQLLLLQLLPPDGSDGSDSSPTDSEGVVGSSSVSSAWLRQQQQQLLPVELSEEALVFSSHELDRLKQRMQELDQQREALRHQQKELRHQHKQMQEDQASKQARLAELSAHCTDVQLLKFGQVIDTGMLDTIGLRNKGADELREVLKSQASTAARELSEWDAHIKARRTELLALLRENTAALTTVTDLTALRRDLETRVNAGRAELWSDPLSARRAAVAERDRLVARVGDQAGQLDSLRLQLAAMRRKDGAMHHHIMH